MRLYAVKAMPRYNVAIVGATGLVGRELLKVMAERDFPVGELRLLASPRSAGRKIEYRGREITVEVASPDAFGGMHFVFASVEDAVSRELAPQAVAAGAVYIDDSAAWRLEPDVPLVIPEVNGEDLREHRGIVAIPNCSTTVMVMALYPLHRANPIRRIVVDTYQSVSGTGGAAMEELERQLQDRAEGRQLKPQVYPHPIALNLIPHIGSFLEDGYSREEWKMIHETRKILHAPEIAVSATCVRVPVMVGHSMAVHVELSRPMEPEEARRLLQLAPGVAVVDSPSEALYPHPYQAAGSDLVYVGRLRRDASHPNGLALWAVGDNLRKGAALNTVQIAETMITRGWLS